VNRTIQSLISIVILVLLPVIAPAADEKYVNSVDQFLHHRFDARNDCMVIGFIDASGSRVLAAGKLDNGTDRTADGDTLFFIGSVSKTFTALLLEDMVRTGEMSLDDPVSKYLPASVHVPKHGGKDITLLDLATHTSGLPPNPDNMTGKDAREQYETYTVEKMYAFLSAYSLSRDPGAEFEYSNVGMALLGDAMARKAGKDFGTLLVERICRPLHMDSTVLRPTDELKRRLAMGHEKDGKPSTPWDLKAYVSAGCIHSTAKDLLKYASAEVGLTESELSPLMRDTQVIRHEDFRGLPEVGLMGHTAMDWVDRNAWQPAGSQFLGHAGGAGSYHVFVGLDLKQRRAVVVLTTANDLSCEAVGWTLLQRLPLDAKSQWNFARRTVGVGIALDLDKKSGELQITEVFRGSPGARAGMTAGMVIEKIDGVAVAGKSLPESVVLLGGSAGRRVSFEVREPSGARKSVEVTRESYVMFPTTMEAGQS
jgi:CubicO group peptidase (beta-lactamase class C family)